MDDMGCRTPSCLTGTHLSFNLPAITPSLSYFSSSRASEDVTFPQSQHPHSALPALLHSPGAFQHRLQPCHPPVAPQTTSENATGAVFCPPPSSPGLLQPEPRGLRGVTGGAARPLPAPVGAEAAAAAGPAPGSDALAAVTSRRRPGGARSHGGGPAGGPGRLRAGFGDGWGRPRRPRAGPA